MRFRNAIITSAGVHRRCHFRWCLTFSMHVRYHHVFFRRSDMRLHQNMYHCPSTCRSCTHFEAVFIATRCSCNASNESGCGLCWSFSASIVPALETNGLPSLGAFSVIRCEGFRELSAGNKSHCSHISNTNQKRSPLAPDLFLLRFVKIMEHDREMHQMH
jgi:hypothetical protein